ncbi:hypothetical protein PTMSG1_08419 [Pyrenophora teres f. maculata]|nr:hypothetical protein PTMSG1_08419 [Pyrenophora teres f. maculata]
MTPPSPEFDISKLIDYYQNLTPVSSTQTTPVKPLGKKKYVRERTPSPVATIGNKTPSPPVSPKDDTAESDTRACASPSSESTQPTKTRIVESPPERPVPVLSRPSVMPVTPCDTYQMTVPVDVTLQIETYYKDFRVEVMGFAGLCQNPDDVPTTSPISRFSQPLQVFHMQHFWPILKCKPSPSHSSSSDASLSGMPKASGSIPNTQSTELNTNGHPPPVSASEMNPASSPNTAQRLPPTTAARLESTKSRDEVESIMSPLPHVTTPNVLDTIVRSPNPLSRNRAGLDDEETPYPSENARLRYVEWEWDDKHIEEWLDDIPQTANMRRRP